ncbi:MAG: dehydrogenase [Verrucomicrobia bacterium]|nr:dehydrogenase [Verrucomicrobiota bacterium]
MHTLRRLSAALIACLFCAAASIGSAQSAPKLQLKANDHIAIVGNALADRFQHSSHFETSLHAGHPQYNLVVRNLAVAGDEVETRHRSENFGSPDDWLKRTKADVVLAFFGFNESFKGYDGLPAFRKSLDTYLKHLKSQDFSGKGAPRVVLFSPIAAERHRDPNYPDPGAMNDRMKDYVAAMAEVAQANSVPFIDLFVASQKLYATAQARGSSLTINGLHLSPEGDALLARHIYQELLGQKPVHTGAAFNKLLGAVREKNEMWHSRYRTIDGFNVYGGRSQLEFESGKGGPKIKNYQVMQEEMSQRDVMTGNRDQRVWAVAKGGDLIVQDNNLPAVTPVISNKPGPKPDQTHVFLSGEEAMQKMTLHSGMKINLFASEKEFPELANPVQMAWDTRGRLWIAAWPNYPGRTPTSPKGDSLLVFEDTNGDGKADKMTTFIDDLNGPTGFQFYKDGVLLVQAPDIWFLRDTNGDGRADVKERVLMGLDSADSHHTANAVCLDPGGAIYLSDGVFHRTQIETEDGPVRNNDAGIFRFEPRTGRLDTYIAYGFANPHGKAFDYWGNDIVTDATGNANYFGAAFSGRLDYPHKHPGMRQFWNNPSRPCPGTGILTSRHFPDEFQGNFLNINVISFQGIYRVNVTDEDSGLKGETQEHLISSTDPNFRPICISTGPDGAIYFADWHNPIIGHMQHHLRDPNRDAKHGRVYRITYGGRPLLKPQPIDGQSIRKLLDLLKEPENQVRDLAKIELGERDAAQVIAATKKWASSLDPTDPAYEHHMMEALWVHQWMNVVNLDLLTRMLTSKEPRARAAAGRVLCYWRDRVPDSLTRFKALAEDPHPRVRLEAVRGASFYRSGEAADVALSILKHPMDYYLEYCLKETLRQLEPYWRKAISEGTPIAADNPVGIERLTKSVSLAELLKLPRTPAVLETILSREGVADSDRNLALDGFAKSRNMSRTIALLQLMEQKKSSGPAAAVQMSRLLPLQGSADLKTSRSAIAKLAETSAASETRQAAWAALAVADGGFDQIWQLASSSPRNLAELMHGIPLLADPDQRAKAYDRVTPLLRSIPQALRTSANAERSSRARFVRIQLPRRGTLTLAEVEVFSEGRNVARQGKARQSSVSSGGEASRAIDGGTDGSFGSGTQTHSQENENNPWWEVDLGTEVPVDSVVVWNRTDAELGRRLDGFTLTLLASDRSEVFGKSGVSAPERSVTIAAAGDPLGNLSRAAIRAAVSMNHQPAEVFALLAGMAGRGEHVTSAAQGIRTLPRNAWPKADAANLATSLIEWARKVPTTDRTSQDYVETVQFAEDVAGLMPKDKAAVLRKEIKGLRVPVFVIRAVREQMRYDTPRVVVETGSAVEIIFENGDFMPHNLVIVRPGTRERIGTAAALMRPDQADGRGRAYVPETPDVLSATRMIEAGQRAVLKITVPNEESEMEFVCTFPGHHQLMWGKFIVTRDVDAYLTANPEASFPAPPAQHLHE